MLACFMLWVIRFNRFDSKSPIKTFPLASIIYCGFKMIYQWKHCRALYPHPEYFFLKVWFVGMNSMLADFQTATQLYWMYGTIHSSLNLKRSYLLRESRLTVPLVPFPWHSCVIEKHALEQSPFSSINIFLLYICLFSPLSTGGFALISLEPCTYTENHRWITLNYKETFRIWDRGPAEFVK